MGKREFTSLLNEILFLCLTLNFPDDYKLQKSLTYEPNQETEKPNKTTIKKVKSAESSVSKYSTPSDPLSAHESGSSIYKNPDSSNNRDTSLISEIKNTMEHFEKFSDHIKEVRKIKSEPLASSTPFSDRLNSKSEPSLIFPERRRRRFTHYYDFSSSKEIMKPVTNDLFLKPLPGKSFYCRGMSRRYYDYEPYKIYGSVDSLSKSCYPKTFDEWKSSFDDDKYEASYEKPSGILKKLDTESGDKQSTSSADSVQDIKIYHNGGILIMQNFKDNFDVMDKKTMSEYSTKLIENCNQLKKEITTFPEGYDKSIPGNSSEESKTSGKMVQFDLIGSNHSKNKSGFSQTFTYKDDLHNRSESGRDSSLKNNGCGLFFRSSFINLCFSFS